MVGSSRLEAEDCGCVVEGCRRKETGLGRGGAGKREYLGFLASMIPRLGKADRCRRSKQEPSRKSGAGKREMQKGQCGERGKGERGLEMQVGSLEDMSNVCGAGGDW